MKFIIFFLKVQVDIVWNFQLTGEALILGFESTPRAPTILKMTKAVGLIGSSCYTQNENQRGHTSGVYTIASTLPFSALFCSLVFGDIFLNI